MTDLDRDRDLDEHRRLVCCPDDPTCPWPDGCKGCGEDWPCEAVRAAHAEVDGQQ
jgi:hypothetical protein